MFSGRDGGVKEKKLQGNWCRLHVRYIKSRKFENSSNGPENMDFSTPLHIIILPYVAVLATFF